VRFAQKVSITRIDFKLIVHFVSFPLANFVIKLISKLTKVLRNACRAKLHLINNFSQIILIKNIYKLSMQIYNLTFYYCN